MPDRNPKGCEFLLTGAAGGRVFSPEDFSPEQRQIADTAEGFLRKEILPEQDRMERPDFPLVIEKMRRCAGLGLFLADIPGEYGGLDLDKATSTLLAEKMGPAGSFSVTYSGQTGIGSLPLVYYGTAAQKERYLGKLASGEWIAAYCLTEPDSGSDALSARTTAVLSADGRHYVLNGVKQFITNAAFADLFTVFAKIDGKRFSAFLVERGFPGLSVGPEEKKMGLKASSTAQVILEDVRVPVGNLLGEPGKGHKIAFNVLNVGRLKLSAMATGMAKGAFAEAASYAGERKQFGKFIGDFGAIREKLADMTAAIFTSESIVYRVAGLVDRRIASLPRPAEEDRESYLKAIEEYAAECAIAKVRCTELLAYVVDEVVQTHGGYGYVSEYPAERFYRDERVNRIFEGTNEINRMLIPSLLLRRADAEEIPLREKVEGVRAGIREEGDAAAFAAGPFGRERLLAANLKKLFLASLGAAERGPDSEEAQMALADMVIAVFALESAVLRAAQAFGTASESRRKLLTAVVAATSFVESGRFRQAASRFAAYALEGGALDSHLSLLEGLSVYPAEGLLPAKRLLAEASRELGRYAFEFQEG